MVVVEDYHHNHSRSGKTHCTRQSLRAQGTQSDQRALRFWSQIRNISMMTNTAKNM